MNNGEIVESISVDRPLTDQERELTRWILENGNSEAAVFVTQLEHARVVALCPCGCASIDFAIADTSKAPPGVHILGDFIFGDESELAGIFVFASDGILSGLEVYGLDIDAPRLLPNPKHLRPFDNAK